MSKKVLVLDLALAQKVANQLTKAPYSEVAAIIKALQTSPVIDVPDEKQPDAAPLGSSEPANPPAAQ